MKIIKTYNWSRRDFTYDAECENCGTVEKAIGGYDDNNYMNNVLPQMVCNKCNHSSNTLGTYKEMQTKYNPNQII